MKISFKNKAEEQRMKQYKVRQETKLREPTVKQKKGENNKAKHEKNKIL